MKKIKTIGIIGDSINAYYSALFLHRSFNSENAILKIRIYPFETKERYRVDYSNYDHQLLHQYLKLDELEWMEAADATFILAQKINHSDSGEFWIPYGRIPEYQNGQFGLSSYWLNRWLAGKMDEAYAEAVSEIVTICKANKGPKLDVYKDKQVPLPYGYCYDLDLLKQYLRKVIIHKDIFIAESDYKEVQLNDDGEIAQVITTSGNTDEVDFIIDCTGKQRVVMKQLKDSSEEKINIPESKDYTESYENYSGENTYNQDDGGIPAYADLTIDNGTKCLILHTRRGRYKREFNQETIGGTFHHNATFSPWSKNCIYIADASIHNSNCGYNSISLLYAMLNSLVLHFPEPNNKKERCSQFNHLFGEICHEICFFENLNSIPDYLEKLDKVFTEEEATLITKYLDSWPDVEHRFNINSDHQFRAWLAGLGMLPQQSNPLLDSYQLEKTYNRFERLKGNASRMSEQLVTQSSFFQQIDRIKEFQSSSF